MTLKKSPWRLHILLGMVITMLWGISHDYSDWQWPVSEGLCTLASFAGAHLFRSRYLVVRGSTL